MSDADDIDDVAAEYVLGTLDADERGAVDVRRRREPALDAAIARWERRFGGLNAFTLPVEPPADMLARIEGRIGAQAMVGGPSATGPGPGGAQVIDLRAQVTRWKRATMAVSALAAALLLTLGITQYMARKQAETFVAVFQKNDESPLFLMSVDLPSRKITIRQVAAPREPGKTFQLWIAHERVGPAPRSLGLIDDRQVTRELPYEPALLRQATFGISVENIGGSTTGRPSPGALHATLIEANP